MSTTFDMADGALLDNDLYPQKRPIKYIIYFVFVNLFFDFRQEKFRSFSTSLRQAQKIINIRFSNYCQAIICFFFAAK